MKRNKRNYKNLTSQALLEQRQERIGRRISKFQTHIHEISNKRAKKRALDVGRERTRINIQESFNKNRPALVEAPMGLGKSHGAVEAAAATGENITILCDRGREEQYDQFKKWCDNLGLDCKILPSFFNSCPTADCRYGKQKAVKVRDWYERGVNPNEMHRFANLPCSKGGTCPYIKERNQINPEKFDVIVGHYTHGHLDNVIESRIVVIDEFPGDSYCKEFTNVQPIITEFVDYSALPASTFTDVLNMRANNNSNYGINKLIYYHNPDEFNGKKIIESNSTSIHSESLNLTYALLKMKKLNNEWEYAEIGNQSIVHDRSTNNMYVLNKPDFESAKQLVGLDSPNCLSRWTALFNDLHPERFYHNHIFSPDEMEAYIRDVLELDIRQVSRQVKPYSSGENVYERQDAAVIERISKQHNSKPFLITTKRAINKLNNVGALQHTSGHEHFGNIRGSNKLSSTRLAIVIGSPHYGDEYIQRWNAFNGISVKRSGKGKNLSYNYSNHFLHYMREDAVGQAIMRFGRDSGGAVVYADTCAIPDWLPVNYGPDCVRKDNWTGDQEDIIRAMQDLTQADTAGVHNHPAVNTSKRYVRDVLSDLSDLGYIKKKDVGSKYVWADNGLNDIGIPINIDLDF